MKKKVLVTGAAGFIGAAVARRVIDEGYEVITIDNLSTGLRENIPPECKFYEGNVYDEEIVRSLECEQLDMIIHIAGQSSGEISFDNPVYDLETNTKSTVMLLNLARKIRCEKFIYASSMSVYGDSKDEKVTENSPTVPKSFYAVGKLASENYMRIFSGYGIKCTALRFFNVYGIGQNLDNLRQGMFSIFLAQAIDTHHIVVKGSKDRFRDFVYIDDVVEAVMLSAKRDGDMFEVYNVSTGIKRTVEELINVIAEKMPYEITVEYVEGTPGDQHGIYGNNSKIKAALGWNPKTDFEDGTSGMIEWALQRRAER